MVSWISETFQRPPLIGEHVILAILLFAVMLVISFAIPLIILVRLPADYLRTPRAQGVQDAGHRIFFGIGIVLKNLFGVILIVLGAILSVPGLPGQGLLTILAGLFLLDFPGKRGLLYKILSQPFLLQWINWLRKRFSRPPLVIG